MILSLLKSFDGASVDASLSLIKWELDAAYGKQLDDIGAILNLHRAGLDDETYKKRIRGIIAVRTCSGAINSLLGVFRLLFETDNIRIINLGQGLMRVEVESDELWAMEYALKTPAAGCKFTQIITWDDNTFTLDDDNLGLDNGELA